MESTIAKALIIMLKVTLTTPTIMYIHRERERESERENILNPRKFIQIRKGKNIIIHADK